MIIFSDYLQIDLQVRWTGTSAFNCEDSIFNFQEGPEQFSLFILTFCGRLLSSVAKYWPSGLIYGITCAIFDANESILTQTRLLYFGNLAQESRSRLHLETRGSPH